MSSDAWMSYLTFAVYLVLLLGIGVWADRRYGGSYRGFVAADKSLGAWVSAVSAAASSESAWVMLGLSGFAYATGPAAYWAAIGCVLGFGATSLWVVRQLRAGAASLEALTVADYVEARLGDRRGLLRAVSAVIVTLFMTAYVVAQFVGSGKQMAGMGLLPYEGGVLLGALIIAVYVVIGGYAAVCWTDLVQGLLMALVMLVLPLLALARAGGVGPVLEELSAAGVGLVPGGEGLGWLAFGFIAAQLGIGTGYLGMPHAVVRYVNIRDAREAIRAAWISFGWSVVVLFGSVTLGLVGRTVVPGLADPEHVLPELTGLLLHPLVAGVVLAAVMAAIMSTADSQLMMAATSLVHDLGQPLGLRWSERRKIWTIRAALALLASVALLLALGDVKVIYTFVLLAWGALGAAFSPVILLCLYWPRLTRAGALASFVVGPAVMMLWTWGLGLESTDGLWPAFLLSLLAALVGSWLSPPPDPALWRKARAGA